MQKIFFVVVLILIRLTQFNCKCNCQLELRLAIIKFAFSCLCSVPLRVKQDQVKKNVVWIVLNDTWCQWNMCLHTYLVIKSYLTRITGMLHTSYQGWSRSYWDETSLNSVKRLDPRLHLWICVFRFVPEGQGGGDYIFLLGLINCKLSIWHLTDAILPERQKCKHRSNPNAFIYPPFIYMCGVMYTGSPSGATNHQLCWKNYSR